MPLETDIGAVANTVDDLIKLIAQIRQEDEAAHYMRMMFRMVDSMVKFCNKYPNANVEALVKATTADLPAANQEDILEIVKSKIISSQTKPIDMNSYIQTIINQAIVLISVGLKFIPKLTPDMLQGAVNQIKAGLDQLVTDYTTTPTASTADDIEVGIGAGLLIVKAGLDADGNTKFDAEINDAEAFDQYLEKGNGAFVAGLKTAWAKIFGKKAASTDTAAASTNNTTQA